MSFNITDVLNSIALISNPSDEKMMKVGEEQLKKCIQANVGQFTLNLLSILQSVDGSITPQLKMTTAIYFKNFVKSQWELIPYGEFQQLVKEHVITLSLNSGNALSTSVTRQLREVIRLILGIEYIDAWPDYLSKVTTSIEASVRQGDYGALNNSLKLLRIVTKRYQTDLHSNEMNKDIYITIHATQKLVLELLHGLKQTLNPANANLLFPPLLRTAKIFLDINTYDLPEYFENHMKSWAADVIDILNLRRNTSNNGNNNADADDDDDDDDEQPIPRIQKVACEIATVFAERYDEEFAEFVPTFLNSVWQLLCSLSARGRDDALAVAGMRFLSAVAGSANHGRLADPAVLRSVCTSVIVPSMSKRADEIELFEDDPRGYIRRDVEGSNAYTRRKAAHDLVVALRKVHNQEITGIIAAAVKTLVGATTDALARGDAEGAWRAKDAAISLLTSVAVNASTGAQGVTELNPLVPVADFFRTQILPEFEAQGVRASAAIVRADCIKFATLFRRFLALSADDANGLLALFVRSLGDESVVVRTYAATGIERLLAIRDTTSNANGTTTTTTTSALRFNRDFLLSQGSNGVQTLIVGLFGCLGGGATVSGGDSDLIEENEYVMKAILRVLTVLKEAAAPYSSDLFGKLIESLRAVAKNPRNPAYNHYLFEAIAVLARSLITAQAAAHPIVESLVLPVLSDILEADVVDFFPYVFQLYALLIDSAPPGSLAGTGSASAGTYVALLRKLLLPVLWDRSGLISAQSRLIQAYIRSAPERLVKESLVEPLLGLCQHLLGALASAQDGYSILIALMAALPVDVMAPYMPNVLRMCFVSLQKHKAARAHRPFVLFMCKMFLVYGFDRVATWADAVQPGVLAGLFTSEFVPHLPTFLKTKEKMFALAALIVLCCVPQNLTAAAAAAAAGSSSPYAQAWAKLVNVAFTMIAGSLDTKRLLEGEDAGNGGEDDDVIDNVSGVGTSFAQLSSTASYGERFEEGLLERNKLPMTFAEVKKTFLFGIHNVSQNNPGKLAPLIQSELSQDNAKILQGLFADAGVPTPYIY